MFVTFNAVRNVATPDEMAPEGYRRSEEVYTFTVRKEFIQGWHPRHFGQAGTRLFLNDGSRVAVVDSVEEVERKVVSPRLN